MIGKLVPRARTKMFCWWKLTLLCALAVTANSQCDKQVSLLSHSKISKFSLLEGSSISRIAFANELTRIFCDS